MFTPQLMRTVALGIMVVATILGIAACCLPMVTHTAERDSNGAQLSFGINAFNPEKPFYRCSIDGGNLPQNMKDQLCDRYSDHKMDDDCGIYAKFRSTAAFAVLAVIAAAASVALLAVLHLPLGAAIPGIAAVGPIGATFLFSMISWAITVGTYNMHKCGDDTETISEQDGNALGPMPIILIVVWILTIPAAILAFLGANAQPAAASNSGGYDKMEGKTGSNLDDMNL